MFLLKLNEKSVQFMQKKEVIKKYVMKDTYIKDKSLLQFPQPLTIRFKITNAVVFFY